MLERLVAALAIGHGADRDGHDRLARQKVRRHGVAGKRVERKDVELLRSFARLPFEHDARVAQRDFHRRLAVFEVGEVLARETLHLRVDLVDAEDIAASSVGAERAGAEADEPDAQAAPLLDGGLPEFVDEDADSALLAVVMGRNAAQARVHEL